MAWYRVFASGSSGNCSLVSDGKTNILIDAGISARRIKSCLSELGLTPDELTAILITHEHSDHVCGLQTLEKYYDIPVFASVGTIGALRRKMPDTMEGAYYFTPGQSFYVESVLVSTFRTPHDAAESSGFKLELENGRSMAVATDLGYMPESVLNSIAGAETVLLESNHDIQMLRYGPYPPQLKERILGERGHLSNDISGETAARLVSCGAERVILAHLSRENNTPETAMKTVEEKLRICGMTPGRDVYLEVASPEDMSGEYIL